MIAGVGLSELRKSIVNIAKKESLKRYKLLLKNIKFIPATIVCVLLLTTSIPAHLNIPYYQMIDEKDYETFTWIRDNIDDYRDVNHSFDKGAIDPFKASPFSSITGLYIVTSTMHPLYGYKYYTDMERFLEEKGEKFICFDISMRMPGSPGTRFTPYSEYLFRQSISFGRRIALEIKESKGKIEKITT